MIVIAGFGFVGRAHYEVFKSRVNFKIVDPLHNNNKLDELRNIDAVICSVPTPEDSNGGCDISNVLDVLSKSPENIPILIKSTIDLNGWNKIKEAFPCHNITFSPEFLRAASSTTDLAETTQFILAGENVLFWRDFYKMHKNTAKFLLLSIEEAILVKYFRNAFLATKVSFFNEVYDFCEAHDIDFDSVRKGITKDKRIRESHSFVDTNYARGWGGMCFPKDTSALLKMAANKNINLNTIAAAVKYNKIIRKKT
jgi:UDPglucose 6-dehydrogenase|tara:strand:+ start:48 stop:809 length:762 start_codon:yes stop_codon:yes gene_type:complete